MTVRIVLAGAVLALAALAVWHPAPHPALQNVAPVPTAAAARGASHHRRRPAPTAAPLALVYVVGAVVKPGLYRIRPGARAADAVHAAGGFAPAADPAGVNLAAYVRDGDEIAVPALGQTAGPRRKRSTVRRSSPRRRRTPSPPPLALDVNTAAADELARVPGIGRAIGQRIVAMRGSEGAFASLDELLDVSGMTQARLDRAAPYLRAP
jgi:competence protein ComEA